MAAGDVTLFNDFYTDMAEGVHDLETDTIKVGLIDSTITPTTDDTTPMWGVGSGVDYDGNEVTPGGNYSTGGPTISNNTMTTDDTGDQSDFDGDNISITQHASNPTNARWGIIYNETATNNEAIGFVDLGSVRDLSAGDFSITWHNDGIFSMGVGTLS